MRLARVPVTIRRSHLVPPGFAGWVPLKRTVLIARGQPLTERLLAHELCHVRQAEEAIWPLAYLIQWAHSGFSYSRMAYEVEARAAERCPWHLTWARDLMKGLWAEGMLD
jgi:hypothetical protein